MKNWVSKETEVAQEKEVDEKNGAAPDRHRTEKRWDTQRKDIEAKGKAFKEKKKAKGEKLKAHEVMYPGHGKGD